MLLKLFRWELPPSAEILIFLSLEVLLCISRKQKDVGFTIWMAMNYTKKLKIITVSGYHGFHDWFTSSTPRNKGIPQLMSEWIISHNYNDLESIEKTIKEQSSDIAALIMEPIINYEPKKGFLEKIRKLTEDNNIVLIFDEMKTGFRLDVGGGQKYFNVIPDLAIFGKALANGFPLSALAGKKHLMKQLEDEKCFFSASYATEKASLAAGIKTIAIIQRDGVISHVWKMGAMLKDGIRKIIDKYELNSILDIVGLAPMTHLIIFPDKDFSVNEIRSYLQQESVKRGVLFVGYHHASFAHQSKDIEYTLQVYDEVFGLLKDALLSCSLRNKIEGKPISAFSLRD